MKNRFFRSAIFIIPALLLIAGVSYATKDKHWKPEKASNTYRSRIEVTNQRAVIVTTTQFPVIFLPADSGDSIIGVQVDLEDFSAGGVACSSATYSMAGSAGEPVAGESSSDIYTISQGFVQIIEESCCDFAGDANGDGQTNVGDAVYLIAFVFKGGPAPICMDEGDVNVDCQVNVGDAVYLISYIFKGGSAPGCGCTE